jgi:septin family protein
MKTKTKTKKKRIHVCLMFLYESVEKLSQKSVQFE